MPAFTETPTTALLSAARDDIDCGGAALWPLSDLVCVSADEAAADVLVSMQRLGFRRALVTEPGSGPVGVITDTDLRRDTERDECLTLRDVRMSVHDLPGRTVRHL